MKTGLLVFLGLQAFVSAGFAGNESDLWLGFKNLTSMNYYPSEDLLSVNHSAPSSTYINSKDAIVYAADESDSSGGHHEGFYCNISQTMDNAIGSISAYSTLAGVDPKSTHNLNCPIHSGEMLGIEINSASGQHTIFGLSYYFNTYGIDRFSLKPQDGDDFPEANDNFGTGHGDQSQYVNIKYNGDDSQVWQFNIRSWGQLPDPTASVSTPLTVSGAKIAEVTDSTTQKKHSIYKFTITSAQYLLIPGIYQHQHINTATDNVSFIFKPYQFQGSNDGVHWTALGNILPQGPSHMSETTSNGLIIYTVKAGQSVFYYTDETHYQQYRVIQTPDQRNADASDMSSTSATIDLAKLPNVIPSNPGSLNTSAHPIVKTQHNSVNQDAASISVTNTSNDAAQKQADLLYFTTTKQLDPSTFLKLSDGEYLVTNFYPANKNDYFSVTPIQSPYLLSNTTTLEKFKEDPTATEYYFSTGYYFSGQDSVEISPHLATQPAGGDITFSKTQVDNNKLTGEIGAGRSGKITFSRPIFSPDDTNPLRGVPTYLYYPQKSAKDSALHCTSATDRCNTALPDTVILSNYSSTWWFADDDHDSSDPESYGSARITVGADNNPTITINPSQIGWKGGYETYGGFTVVDADGNAFSVNKVDITQDNN